MFFAQKATFLEEVNRVLCKEGVARIDVYMPRSDLPVEYARTLEIWHGESQIPFWEYVQRFGSLRKGEAKRRSYLELRKTPVLHLDLEFVCAIDLNNICRAWYGSKSIYRAKG